ncbi:MAG: molybdenum ABC transporter ATP-binding protein [Pirellulales bacterium]
MSHLKFACRRRLNAQFELDAVFDCPQGVTALFGPSGSGKTTILNMIAGVLQPAVGRIELAGEVLDDRAQGIHMPPDRRRIGVVFQDHLLFPHLSVRENLQYGTRRPNETRVDFNKVVEILEVGLLLDRYPRSLSGGQRQRIALGRAILRAPRLLLMDEPLAGLDLRLKERILAYLERLLVEFNLPTLFVSHDQTDVRRLAERVVVLDAGRVVDVGASQPTVDRAVMRTQGPVNLVRVAHVRTADGHWEGTLGTQPLAFTGHDNAEGEATTLQPGGTALIQFRPSDVTLTLAAVEKTSARNRLTGEVREVVMLPQRAFVAVDIGQLIWAEVMHDTVRELNLAPGIRVTCLIKASAALAVV